MSNKRSPDPASPPTPALLADLDRAAEACRSNADCGAGAIALLVSDLADLSTLLRAAADALRSLEAKEEAPRSAPGDMSNAEAVHPRAAQIAQWLAGTGWIDPDEEDDVALDLTLSFPPCARNEYLPQARLLELCVQFGVTETDDLKHRLEDWARWRTDVVELSVRVEAAEAQVARLTRQLEEVQR